MSARASLLVERALRDYPKTRSSDRSLILCVWWLQKPDYQQNLNGFIMGNAIMPETITRHRRKLQEAGKYAGTPEVMAKRYKKFKQMRGYGSTSNDAMDTVL